VRNTEAREADDDLSVWEFPVHGGTPRLLRRHAWADHISPDGSWISFRANRTSSGSREIWLMDVNGNYAGKLFENATGMDNTFDIEMLPDGRFLYSVRGAEP
jgi:Tol biopolymer transport system component